jgi:hypothetical protein
MISRNDVHERIPEMNKHEMKKYYQMDGINIIAFSEISCQHIHTF